MQIFLCAATEFEIAPTIRFISERRLQDIDVVLTGLGMMAATYHLTRRVAAQKPGLLLQAGIAGNFNTQLSLGQVVVVRNEAIGDLGVEQEGSFRSLFDMNFLKDDEFPFTARELPNHAPLLHQSGLTIVDSVTVNEISTSGARIMYYKSVLGADIESMEGAALHYVGLMEDIPFLQLRALSNIVGERDKSKWQIQPAITNLNNELQRILLNLLA